jgi:hypothetical protein
MTAADLRELCPSLIDWSWSALNLWPETPGDDYEFWLYCVHELQRRGAPLPAAGAKLCDLAPIEPKLRAWERQKKVGEWLQALQAPGSRRGTFAPGPAKIGLPDGDPARRGAIALSGH